MKKNSFLYGTFLLIIANFIIRFLGFAYKILLSRIIGPQGIGLFHLVLPILMTFITFTASGLPVAVSKLIAHHLSLNNQKTCNKILGLSIFMGLLISLLLSTFLLYKRKYISEQIIQNNDAYLSLIALAPAIPLITLSSIFRGYYYGINNVSTPGVSQILEQIFRIAFVIGSLFFLTPLEPKYASAIAILGISVGEFIGLLWLLSRFKIHKASYIRKTYHILKEGNINILHKIILMGAPITITRVVGVFIQSVNAVLIPQKLQQIGYTSKESIAIFGKITGMALPLLFVPFIVTSALVVNIIPTISQEAALHNWKNIRLKSNLAIRMTLLVSIPTMMFFIFFGEPICHFIYHQPDVGSYLSILAYSTVFLSLHHTVSGILHGMGKQIITTLYYFLGMIIQLFCTYYLVPNPKFGLNGFIIGFLLSAFLVCMLHLISLNFYIPLKVNLRNSVIKPFAASIVMIIFIVCTYNACIKTSIGPWFAIFISIILGFISYSLTVLLSGSINLKTLKYIFSKK